MNRLNSNVRTVRHLQQTVQRLETRSVRLDLFSKIVFPLIALIVAGLGAYTSWNAHKLSKDAFDMNVEPLLTSVVSTGYGKEATLRLYNDGINPVYDIHVRRDWVVFNLKKNLFGSQTTSSRDWKFIDCFLPHDSSFFPIDKSDVDLVVHNTLAEAHWVNQPPYTLLPVMAFHIRYRRMPDKKLYFARNYLFITINEGNEFQMFFSPDEPLFVPFFPIEPKLDSLFKIHGRF